MAALEIRARQGENRPARLQTRDMPNLDFVRSVAVITVVAEHFLLARGVQRVGPFQVAWFGVIGVMVFFVLTCLVLMWSLERKPHTLDFYIRRFFRIYPLAWLALAIALVLHAPVSGSPADFFQFHGSTLHGVLLQMSLLPSVSETAVGVMWSLPYEIGMYFLLPALFFFVRRNFALWPLLVLWAVTLFPARNFDPQTHNFAVAIGYFLPGVMAYVGFSKWRPRLPGWMLAPALAVLWMAFWYHADFRRCWFFCLAAGLLLPLFRQMRSPWVLTPSRIVARYSYGIYLGHPFAIALGFYVLRGYGFALQMAVSLVALVVLPVAAYHLLEEPMIRLGSRLAKRAEAKYEQDALPTEA